LARLSKLVMSNWLMPQAPELYWVMLNRLMPQTPRLHWVMASAVGDAQQMANYKTGLPRQGQSLRIRWETVSWHSPFILIIHLSRKGFKRTLGG
jgi:hypothetical protein